MNGRNGGSPGRRPGGRPLVGLPPWIRQSLACLLLFLLSARLPPHLLALLTALSRTADGRGGHSPLEALALLISDGFGVLCAIYLSHQSLRGVRLLRCYPPRRLIPLGLHLLGLVWGLLNLAPPLGGSAP